MIEYIILGLFFVVILGFFSGKIFTKVKLKISEKKLISNAKRVLDGKIKNLSIDEEGRKIEVTKFVLPGEKAEDKEIRVDLLNLKKINPAEKNDRRKKSFIGNILRR